MCYPLIGNYGINSQDYESIVPHLEGLIVKEHCTSPSNFRVEKSLERYLKDIGIPGIAGIDTRALTRKIRSAGSMKAMICHAGLNTQEALETLRTARLFTDHVKRVSRKDIEKIPNAGPKVVVIDCGIKTNIIRSLKGLQCNLTIVPYDTDAKVIDRMRPDGIFISNGPGNPEDVPQVIELVRTLQSRYVLFGICLGLQIIALANGARTFKMKFGHRGSNHPIKNLITGKIEITSQNHSYAVVPDSLAGTALEITHINLLDRSVEGIRHKHKQVSAVQYHPESSPGPQDSFYLFEQFIKTMREKENQPYA
jgi:carbamoyl-phosphate synthase small subunit